MLKYCLKEYHNEIKYTGRRLETIPTEVIDCEPKILGQFDTLKAGLDELGKYTSTARKIEGMVFPIWSLCIVILEEIELLNLDEPDDASNWVHTGNEWAAKEDIQQPYAAPDVDRSIALAELAKQYGTLEFDGRKYYLLDDDKNWPEAICSSDPISALDGTQKVYGLDVENGKVVGYDEGGFITWYDDGTFRE